MSCDGNSTRTATIQATALADLEDDLARADDILAIAIERAATRPGSFIDTLEDDAEDDAETVTVDRRSIADLREAHDDVAGEIASAFANHDWEIRRALRAFRQAFVREKVS